MKRSLLLIFILISLVHYKAVLSDDKSGPAAPMNNQRLDKLIKKIDSNAEGREGYWVINYDKYQALVLTDEKADRMRVIVQISKTDSLKPAELYRLMQANFDSTLDARYGIAKGVLWSAFIHPLSTLSDQEFFSGLAQAITLAETYGTTYSSGALIFRRGDSRELQKDYYRKIMRKANSI